MSLFEIELGQENLELPFRILVKDGTAPADELLTFFFEYGQLLKMFGFNPRMKTKNLDSIVVSESEFDFHEKMRETPVPGYISREEGYFAARRHAKERAKEIIEGLDAKYPKVCWGDNFPKIEVIAYIFNALSDFETDKSDI